MADEPIYDEWIAHRRASEPSRDVTDRVMASLEDRDVERDEKRGVQRNTWVRLAARVNESPSARWAACLAASLVGSLPFLFVAHVAELLIF